MRINLWLAPATLLIDAGYLVILGALFGLAALAGPQGRPAGRSLACALVALAVFGIGLPVFFYARWPDWMWAYYAGDPANVPTWIVALCFGLYAPVYVAGFFAAFEMRRVHRLLGLAVLAFGVALQVALIAATWERYRRIGAYADLPGPSDAWMTGSSVALVAGIALLWWLSRRRPESR